MLLLLDVIVKFAIRLMEAPSFASFAGVGRNLKIAYRKLIGIVRSKPPEFRDLLTVSSLTPWRGDYKLM